MPDVLVENMSIRMANARFMSITLASRVDRAKTFHGRRADGFAFAFGFAGFAEPDCSGL